MIVSVASFSLKVVFETLTQFFRDRMSTVLASRIVWMSIMLRLELLNRVPVSFLYFHFNHSLFYNVFVLSSFQQHTNLR